MEFRIRPASDEDRRAGFAHVVAFTIELGLDEIVLVK